MRTVALMYAKLIRAGRKTIEEVPEEIRALVEEILGEG